MNVGSPFKKKKNYECRSMGCVKCVRVRALIYGSVVTLNAIEEN